MYGLFRMLVDCTLAYERQLELDADAQARISSDINQQLQANAFTIAALMTDNLAVISRERWTFQRNERWFEDTLPHLGEFHFKQAFRVSPATFRFLVESCRNQQAVDKLLTIGTIEQKGKALEMKPYVATSSAQTKGVIYLRGNFGSQDYRPIWKNRAHYFRRPRPLVCHKCHTLGHKADVCPQDAVRCGGCGHEHDPAQRARTALYARFPSEGNSNPVRDHSPGATLRENS
ncbi:hypothetical protein HPB47_000285 [Ixodes persulcatus]|uniref:Uncharacterized protein n=1 Tax=Ixodes persulcatus TaxID=34615 RepID=A0AC60PS32_IXOPE|nr:hypothetical protein HPB47_000285 [Ixodes persulcatus]